MADDESKRAVLETVLARTPAEGFCTAARDTLSAFPGGAAEIAAFWPALVDDALRQNLTAMELPSLSIRTRIRNAVLARLALLRPHKEAARSAAAILVLPQHLALGTQLAWASADVIWRAAGDEASDFNHYTKRAMLAGILSATTIAWFGDDSEDERHTAAFLDARIDNVMEFEKLKARVKERFADATSSAGKTS